MCDILQSYLSIIKMFLYHPFAPLSHKQNNRLPTQDQSKIKLGFDR